ncbi:MAG: MoxR family ATPase [Deltaproteobacteria bacterium]|nr:MoxR family ATPase [Deltaproteobacteria bacterium]MBP7286065.1 MoxR family ATPase [Nannocystaceae bacterium]
MSSVLPAPRPVTPPEAGASDAAEARAAVERVRRAVCAVIRGKDEVVELALVALVARGHLLIEDIPGVGKSTLARTLAQSVGGEFRRVQFTSDLLPADLIGVSVLRPGFERSEFRKGPVFANFVLADEINRSPPRTQSALLEAMGEQTVSVEGESHPLPSPFMVIATQNPTEHHGTYPLPESQRDRFMLRLSMGYTAAEVEQALLAQGGTQASAEVAHAGTLASILAAQLAAEQTFVHADLAGYAQRVVQATRSHPGMRWGVSTRGALAWMRAAKARAYLSGRAQIDIDDLQELAVAALAHRIIAAPGAGDEGGAVAAEQIRELVATTAVPR